MVQRRKAVRSQYIATEVLESQLTTLSETENRRPLGSKTKGSLQKGNQSTCRQYFHCNPNREIHRRLRQSGVELPTNSRSDKEESRRTKIKTDRCQS